MFSFAARKIVRKNNGFTLIELLVVIAIVIILMLITLPSFNKFSKQQILDNETKKIISQLQLAQTLAKSGNHSDNAADNYSVLGYYLDFATTTANNEYFLKRHNTTPASVIEEKLVLNDEVIFSVDSLQTRVYFELSSAHFYCLPTTYSLINTKPTESDSTCPSQDFLITLTNSLGDTKIIHVEVGGAIYETTN